MKLIKFAVLAAFLAFGSAFAQETEKTMAFKIVVDGEDADGSNALSWSTDGHDLENLAVGESRTITMDGGKEIVVTKTDAGMEFNVNGENILVPDMGAHGTHMAFVGADGVHGISGDVDVEVVAIDGVHETVDVRVMGAGDHAMPVHEAMGGVTIISGVPLDSSVRESIRSVLISAGVDEEVRFIDGSEEEKQVRVVKKRVEIQQ